MAKACSCCLAIAFALLTCATAAFGSGFTHSDNFIVFAPDQETASEILKKAEQYRRILAIQWFGEELSSSSRRTLTSVIMDGKTTHAEFWAMDGDDGKHYKLDLVNFREETLDAALAHEISHMIMELRFDGELPIWTDEGLATFQSHRSKRVGHASLMKAIAETREWPALKALLATDRIDKYDRTSYAVATSLTSYLLRQGDAQTLFDFALSGRRIDWNHASQEHYAMSLAQLEQSWRTWVTRMASQGPLLTIVTPPRMAAAKRNYSTRNMGD
ncbi:MAG: hypothetical protein R6U98_23295 [Pirellulaceae bacterium]